MYVLMYVKNSLKCSEIKWPSNITLECIGVNIHLSKEMSLTVICIYRKPTAGLDFYDQLKALLAVCNHKKEILLFGDFNVNWDNKKDRKSLKLITDYFNLTQLIEEPTRITHRTRSRIDLVFTNKLERITNTHNLLTGLSDHNAIFFSRKVKRSENLCHSSANRTTNMVVPNNQLVNVNRALKDGM